MSIAIWFLLFIIYAFVGWCVEVVFTFFTGHKFVNRGFLVGPLCPIYGFGAIAITILLQKYVSDPLILFVMAMLIFSVLEYSTSWLMEKIFNARWWDYHNMKFNLNGRICLETMVPFGLGGLLVIYVLNPFFLNFLHHFSGFTLNAFALAIALIFLIDNIISFNIIVKIKSNFYRLAQDSTEEITTFVQNQLKKKSFLNQRLLNAFPQFQFQINLKKLRKMRRQFDQEITQLKKKISD